MDISNKRVSVSQGSTAVCSQDCPQLTTVVPVLKDVTDSLGAARVSSRVCSVNGGFSVETLGINIVGETC
jgi:hypothetical protein